MKIRIETGGAQPIKPDFGMLREGLRVAQRTTPTAIANEKARALHDHAEAIVRMFAGPEAEHGRPGKGSFHPTPSAADADQTEV